MKFDETNKVILGTMTRIEAKAFVKFLRSEIARHRQDIQQAGDLIMVVKEKFNL